MAGPIIVEGPDGQEYEFPEGTSPDVMKQAMRKRYAVPGTPAPAPPPVQQPQTRNTIRTGPREFPTSSDRMSGREDTQIMARAQRVAAEQAQAAQDARLGPVKAAGKTAAGAAMSDFSAGFETPKPNLLQSWLASGPQEMGVNRPVESAGIAAEREVFNKAGVMMPDVAAGSRLINSAALGLPAILNKDFRKTVVQAEEDQPGMALFGDVLGFAAPGAMIETGIRGVARAAQPLINRLTPRGGSMLERGTRVTGRTVGLAGSGATQSGVYQATVGESIAAGKEDRAPSLAGAAEGFKTGATDPVALFALPAALVANRIGTYISSSGATATPANIAAQIDQATGRLLNPRRAIGQTLDMDLAGGDIRPQAMDRIIRELESAGLSVEDIGRLMESVQERLSSLPESQAGRLTFGQALAEATARDRPQALPTILSTLRERRLSGRQGDTSAGIISGVTQDLERSQIDFLSDSIGRNIGDTTLPEVDEQIRLARAAISNQYNQVLAQADPTRPEARGIAMIVAGDKSKGVLSRRAANAGFESVDAYIAAMPDAAGHWLRSALSKASRKAPEGREKIELQDTVSQLDELLETNEGYRQARMQWGHEAGLEDAQDWARNFTNIARDEGAVADLLAELNRMPEAQRNVAMSSLRNEVLKSVRGGPEDASLRLSKWMTRGALDALEQLGEGGQALANDLRFLNREQRWLFKVDPETLSPTAVRMLSAQTAQQAGNAPMSNMLSGAGQPGAFAQDVFISAIAGQPVPLMTTQRFLNRAADRVFRPRTETLQDVSRLYMGRRGNIPTPTEQPDFTPLFNRPPPAAIPPGGPPPGTPPAGGTPPQAPRTVGVAPAAAGAPAMAAPAGAPAGAPVPTTPTRPAGFGIGPNAQATLQQSAFGSIGGSAYGSQNDVNQDGVIDEQDAYAGAFLGGVSVPMAAGGLRTVGRPRTPGGAAPSGRTVGQGGYFGRQSMRPPGSGPSPREIELRQEWSTATPIVTQARTTAQSAQQAADAALQSKAPADIARAKDQKKALVGQLQEAQASRAGMDTPEDARLAETLASLAENTSDPVLLSTQISAAKTSLDRLLTDIGSPVQGNLIPVRTNILTRTQAPRSAAEGPQDRASVTRYAEGGDEVKPQGFGAGENPSSDSIRQKVADVYAETEGLSNRDRGSRLKQAVEDYRSFVRTASADELRATSDLHFDRDLLLKLEAPQLAKMIKTLGLPAPSPTTALNEMRDAIKQAINPSAPPPVRPMGFGASTPKTPQQAARFETPGSPEYEAAVAKGLDMSQAGRMGRAKEMGFDTETVLYHGTKANFDSFRASDEGSYGPGVYLTTDPNKASAYSRGGEKASVYPVIIRGKLLSSKEMVARQVAESDPQNYARNAVEKAKAEGFAGVISDDGKTISIFDPSNIRSVNAAFDPEKSTSSTLLAAAPFAAVGGAGLTLAGEDARNQRTVGKPKASQSARTVGKAKTN